MERAVVCYAYLGGVVTMIGRNLLIGLIVVIVILWLAILAEKLWF